LILNKLYTLGIAAIIVLMVLFPACRKKGNPTPQLVSGKAFVVPSDSVAEVFKSKPTPAWAPKIYSYKPSAERYLDLLHSRLEVSPFWVFNLF
jgi:hypothetical protein